jgi:methylglutaconyl-CoA hydratase
MKYNTIELIKEKDIATVWFNRPEIHNAFNQEMIAEIIQCFEHIKTDDAIRAVVIRGRGKSFCAGADLNWMRDVAKFSYHENYEESYQLSRCFYTIYTCPKPTIALVHGAAIGGANGLLASCDFAYCTNDTVFSLSEVKIGIVPACISPYIIKRTGEFTSRELMLTGLRFKGKSAEEYKLVNKSMPESDLEDKLTSILDLLRTSGPKAISHCKNLINKVVNHLSLDEALEYTAEIIADIRASEEGQEGMDAFLNKRKPNWVS